MRNYVHGMSKNKPATLRMTADQIKADLEHLRRIEAQVLAETAAKEKELARIRAARKKLEPKATYLPTAEAIAYWEEHHDAVEARPRPLLGGQHNLYLASLEAATWDRTHRRGKRQDQAA